MKRTLAMAVIIMLMGWGSMAAAECAWVLK